MRIAQILIPYHYILLRFSFSTINILINDFPINQRANDVPTLKH